ncbi:MAG: deoxyribose-phosphate aldolase [Bryobacter sp.]|nr:deoxyribose-phosphate aldolase [Bryobacter sp.]
MKPQDLAGLIDHTLLRPDASFAEIDQLCAEARAHQFASVCVNPFWVKAASTALRGSSIKTCTVLGFPLGANLATVKAEEARLAIAAGAEELDMVLNIGALKTGLEQVVAADLAAVGQVAQSAGVLWKVILETALLTDTEKRLACRLAMEAGADFVKTSTGFARAGATVEDVRLMREVVGPARGVKASGGIRSFADALRMVEAGANRLGTSAGVAIVTAEVPAQDSAPGGY